MRRIKKESGMSAMILLSIMGGLFVLWLIFMFIMDHIGSRHQAKIHDRMQKWEERAKSKNIEPTKRNLQGYQITY